MKSVVAVILFVAAVTGSAIQKPPITTIEDLPVEELGSRIISGQPAIPGQFPWQVANSFSTGSPNRSFCAAALICDSFVLTAGHCAVDSVHNRLYFGSVNQSQEDEPGRVVLETPIKILHELYNIWTLTNDIALLRLREKVNFTDNIQPIILGDERLGVDVPLTVSGWGKTSDASNVVSPILNYVELNTISNKECEDIYGLYTVKNTTVCCRGRPEHSTCNGDSGGALVQQRADGKWVHVGIVSFIHIDGCASGNPSGYTRTASYLDWIKEKTNGICTLAE